MDVKVLGAGCANCHRLEERVVTALAEIGDDSTVEMVTDFARIAGYGVMTTPALLVDEHVVMSGRVPDVPELVELLTAV